ncbi:MAG TPA: hypothetical protein VK816_07895, partial [Jatrophihabitantaceae bacterium]|nr:hypothetical protein [Jatrophihabitantaceae bacterium]
MADPEFFEIAAVPAGATSGAASGSRADGPADLLAPTPHRDSALSRRLGAIERLAGHRRARWTAAVLVTAAVALALVAPWRRGQPAPPAAVATSPPVTAPQVASEFLQSIPAGPPRLPMAFPLCPAGSGCVTAPLSAAQLTRQTAGFAGLAAVTGVVIRS